MIGKEFWQKRIIIIILMNYKTIKYKCNCKYLWLNGTKRSPKCPEHNTVQNEITLWCKTCGVKIITTPLAGRRIYCHKHSTQQQNKRVKKRRQEKYNKDHGIETELTAEGIRERDERQLKDWYESCRRKWPIPETPILDSYTGRML